MVEFGVQKKVSVLLQMMYMDNPLYAIVVYILSNAIDDKDIQAFTQVVHYHL